ncbi:phosphopentomutase [Aquimarina sediminis]|uniref:phosphopentomutase n=1 Tax=Aquimarina sediminis TaxID=2070536 RepID=UPI000CA04CE7|nr:phosphopentomutase [Aquimarina sediminis]
MKVVILVLDSVGIGELPDAHLYNDTGSNTLGNIVKALPDLKLPNISRLGMGNIDKNIGLRPDSDPLGAYGKAIEMSKGKDTTTGHWEISGIVLDKPFPTFPKGFSKELIEIIERKIGVSIIGNVVGSGTKIIENYGEEHLQTGKPIVYTSADSVFQIAMHEDVIPIARQYEICEDIRSLLKDPYEVGRVIARPFVGTKDNFTRTANRKDFSIKPIYNTILDNVKNEGKEVVAIGKINDIFSGSGITQWKKTTDNNHGIQETITYIKQDFDGLIFTNLIDFDMHYGHRRDVEGYGKCLMEFDRQLPMLMKELKSEDVLIITADHGNDPTASGTDHTREHIPILVYGKSIKKGVNIGTRASFADIGATITDMLDISRPIHGTSFWRTIQKE